MAPSNPSPRGTSICRGCDGRSLVSVLDLGDQPLSNELISQRDVVPETFPLHLRVCTVCGLGQVGEFVRPERIFGDDYPYLSATSETWVAHARAYAEAMRDLLDLRSTDLVLEVASNDGYLLSGFKESGHRVLGIEPALNVADLARSAGVPTIHAFFGVAVAERLLVEHGHPRLIVANNVMAHVPDLHDFVAGLATLCDEQTLITVENPSMMNLFLKTQFDTIYHEHFSYLTATSVQHVASAHGLDLVRVDELSTHGGSNRYFLRRAGATRPDASVSNTLNSERTNGVLDRTVWERFAMKSRESIGDVRNWLEDRRVAGAVVAGYGAAAKATVLLNAVGAASHHVSFIVDGSRAKQGRFVPGPQTPVLAPEHLAEVGADDVIIFPWNIAAELVPIIRGLRPNSRVWVPRPRMEQLA